MLMRAISPKDSKMAPKTVVKATPITSETTGSGYWKVELSRTDNLSHDNGETESRVKLELVLNPGLKLM